MYRVCALEMHTHNDWLVYTFLLYHKVMDLVKDSGTMQ